MPPKKGNKTFITTDTTATDVQDISAKVIDSASASETVSPTKNPAPLPPPGKKEPLKRKPADAPRSRSLETKSTDAPKSEAQLKAELKHASKKLRNRKLNRTHTLHSKNKSASDVRKPSAKPRRRTAPPPAGQQLTQLGPQSRRA